MHRRDLFTHFGAAGLGMTLGPAAARADEHKQDGKAAGPLHGGHAHFCGIHVAKNNPKLQFVTQHYCAAHTDDALGDPMFQCLLFDGTGQNAKLVGVEYIVSDKQYRMLPDAEKKYWHPHTYEVLAGGLIAPGMDAEGEQKFMSMIMTTWGKTWHTWPDPTTPVPLGEPLLIWALTGDGQADDKVIAARDKEFKVETAKVRERRIKQVGLEVPQVSAPKSMDTVGRQWTDSGDDKPTKKSK